MAFTKARLFIGLLLKNRNEPPGYFPKSTLPTEFATAVQPDSSFPCLTLLRLADTTCQIEGCPEIRMFFGEVHVFAGIAQGLGSRFIN